MKNIKHFEEFINENNEEKISIFDYVEGEKEDGYIVALYNKEGELEDDNVDPEDYSHMLVNSKGDIIYPYNMRGFSFGRHSGHLKDMPNVDKSKDFKSKY
jgi:hypothetical protein